MMTRLGTRHGYWLPWAVRLRGDVDAGRLSDAVALVAGRHPTLRTTLVPTAAGLVQRVGTETPAAVAHLQGGRRPVAVSVADSTGPLRDFFDHVNGLDVLAGHDTWRIAVVPHDGGCDVGLATHHLVFDQWSWGLFLVELGAAYRHLATGRPLPDAPAVSYSDYAHWQRRHIAGVTYERHLDHWRRLVAGYPPGGLRLVSSVPPAAAGPALTTTFGLGAALVQPLRRLGTTHGATLFVVLAALLQATLAVYARTPGVLIGLVTANRRRPELRDVIGFFANGRILRTTVRTDRTVTALVAEVAEQWRCGHRHQELHLEKTVLDLGLPDVVNVKFALRNALEYLPAPDFGPSVHLTDLPTPQATSSRRHLNVWFEPTASGLAGYATYRTDVLQRADAEQLTAAYVDNLRIAAAAPATRLGLLQPRRPAGAAWW